MANSEQEPKKTLAKAPEGTYSFLQDHQGFKNGVFGTLEDGYCFDEPFLLVTKEELCPETGGSCMVFRLVRLGRRISS